MLVELLVVIAIIGTLVGLLLPAVQAAGGDRQLYGGRAAGTRNGSLTGEPAQTPSSEPF